MSGINYTPAGYGGVEFPPWAEGLGWMMVVLPVVVIIAGFIYQLVKSGFNVSVFGTIHLNKKITNLITSICLILLIINDKS